MKRHLWGKVGLRALSFTTAISVLATPASALVDLNISDGDIRLTESGYSQYDSSGKEVKSGGYDSDKTVKISGESSEHIVSVQISGEVTSASSEAAADEAIDEGSLLDDAGESQETASPDALPAAEEGQSTDALPAAEEGQSADAPPAAEEGQSADEPPAAEEGQSSDTPPAVEEGQSSDTPPANDTLAVQAYASAPVQQEQSAAEQEAVSAVSAAEESEETTAEASSLGETVKNYLTIILDSLKITSSDDAPVFVDVVSGQEVHIELDGDTVLTNTGKNGAGLEKYCSSDATGTLFIEDNLNTAGTLTAQGGSGAAGIGSSSGSDASNISITGGTITANGGSGAAGIGGGYNGNASDITISGAVIENAKGGNNAAGIGGGQGGDATNINIKDSAIIKNAEGGYSGAGIGSGQYGGVNGITIDNATIENATGGTYAAGIGLGHNTSKKANAQNIVIKNSELGNVTGGTSAAGIGGGRYSGCDGITIENTNVTGIITGGGAGIGSGSNGSTAYNISIKDSNINEIQGGTGAAGIGGGSGTKYTQYITIENTTINKVSGGSQAAGIGSGSNSSRGAWVSGIEIINSIVNAYGGDATVNNRTQGGGAGIGGGYNTSSYNISISGAKSKVYAEGGSGTKSATKGNYAADIGAGYKGLQYWTISVTDGAAVTLANGHIGNGNGTAEASPATYEFEQHTSINDYVVGEAQKAKDTLKQYLFNTSAEAAIIELPQEKHSGAKCDETSVCTVCGVELQATGHTPGAAATCSDPQVCTVCGAELAPATGAHTSVVDPAVEPTYTSAGLTAGSHCSVCGTIIEAQQVIPMLEREETAPAAIVDVGALNFDCYNIASGANEDTHHTAEIIGDDVVVTSTDDNVDLEHTKFVSAVEYIAELDDAGVQNIIFAANGTKFSFSVKELRTLCAGAEYTVTYENGVAVLRTDAGNVIYGTPLDRETNQMTWVQYMDALKAQAEEMVKIRLIYG